MHRLIVLLVLALTLAGFAASTSLAQPDPPVEVAEIIELPLLAGPARTSAHLAPDGARIAYAEHNTVCILDIDTLAAMVQAAQDAGRNLDAIEDELAGMLEESGGMDCVSMEAAGMPHLEHETIRWSPDGRYLTMTGNFFKFFRDTDIWVLDTTTLTAANLTDDGDARFDISADENPPIDVVPRWMPDGRIAFVRYENDSPHIYTIQPDGTELQQVGQIETTQRFAVTALAISDDGRLAYNLWVHDDDLEDLSGLWISDLDGSNAQQVWHNADRPIYVPAALDWSPDGQYIAFSLPPDYSMEYTPENSYWRTVRVSDGQEVLISPDHYVWNIGWAPGSSAILYTTANMLEKDIEGLYFATEPGAPGRMLVPAQTDPDQASTALVVPTPQQNQLLTWADNDTVLVTRAGMPRLLVIRLAVE